MGTAAAGQGVAATRRLGASAAAEPPAPAELPLTETSIDLDFAFDDAGVPALPEAGHTESLEPPLLPEGILTVDQALKHPTATRDRIVKIADDLLVATAFYTPAGGPVQGGGLLYTTTRAADQYLAHSSMMENWGFKALYEQSDATRLLAILGPSGSGKSTLMNILGCLDTPTAGKYILNQHDVSKMEDNDLAEVRNKEIGFVFQQFNLLTHKNTQFFQLW